MDSYSNYDAVDALSSDLKHAITLCALDSTPHTHLQISTALETIRHRASNDTVPDSDIPFAIADVLYSQLIDKTITPDLLQQSLVDLRAWHTAAFATIDIQRAIAAAQAVIADPTASYKEYVAARDALLNSKCSISVTNLDRYGDTLRILIQSIESQLPSV
jgi:hypothetical protein